MDAKLMSLVTMAKTNPNAVEYLHESLRQAEQAGDRKVAQHIRNAIRCAEKAAK